jgi:anti-sigma regulatory factor (Ser/Thr protein kinase)
MTKVQPGMRRQLASAGEAVDRLCGELRAGLLADLPPRERFAIELLLREALTNAVVHGAGNRRAARIDCEILPIAGGLRIRVADGGQGFEWRRWRNVIPRPQIDRGRGLHILYRYASEVRFSENGSQVELTRIFAKEKQDEL